MFLEGEIVNQKTVLKNIRYSLVANLITMMISIILTLIIPKALNLESYGYYQLYLFYVSFVSFFHFGIVDGIYLKIGGKLYEDIDKQSIGSEFWYIIILNVFLSSIVIAVSSVFVEDQIKLLILIFTCFASIIINGKTLLLFVLQCTNRIKEYAKYTRYDRILFFILCLFYLILGNKNAILLIFLDILARLFVLFLMIFSMNDLVLRKITPIENEFRAMYDNAKVGLNLTLSYLASQLIIGIVRFAIEKKWSIVIFGQISLTLSISNMVMTFINAVSAIMFPLLRRTDENQLPMIYASIRNIFVPLLFTILFLFQPLKTMLNLWLPNYSTSIVYMGILFPIFIYESKVSLLTNTYLKTLRMESEILKANIVTLILGGVSTIMFVWILPNINLAVFSILILLIFRANYSEILLSKILKLNLNIKISLEFILTIIFVIANLYTSSMVSLFIYSGCYAIYIYIYRYNLISSFNMIKKNYK